MGVWKAEEMQSHENSAFSLFSKEEMKCFVRKTKTSHWSVTRHDWPKPFSQARVERAVKGTLVHVYYPHATQEQSSAAEKANHDCHA